MGVVGTIRRMPMASGPAGLRNIPGLEPSRMPVAVWTHHNLRVERNFEAPKRAGELRYWWRAAHKVLAAYSSMPKWEMRGVTHDYQLEIDWITLTGELNGSPWRLDIARKGRLR